MRLLKKVYRFLKYPRYQQYRYPPRLKWKLFFGILGLQLVMAFIAAIFLQIVSSLMGIDLGTHALEKMMEEYSPLMILLLAVGMAPLLEELIFRAPLGLFRTSPYFNIALYCSILAFGFIHIFNFEGFEEYLWMAPILVAPQLIAGVFLGFIRVRMGLLYAILLHAAFNFCLLSPFILIQIINPS